MTQSFTCPVCRRRRPQSARTTYVVAGRGIDVCPKCYPEELEFVTALEIAEGDTA